jgi:hypothetical protein
MVADVPVDKLVIEVDVTVVVGISHTPSSSVLAVHS